MCQHFILSRVHYSTVQNKMISSCVLAIFQKWIHKGKEAIHMAYSKPKTVAKSAKKSSYVAGCPANNRGGGFCKDCDRAQ